MTTLTDLAYEALAAARTNSTNPIRHFVDRAKAISTTQADLAELNSQARRQLSVAQDALTELTAATEELIELGTLTNPPAELTSIAAILAVEITPVEEIYGLESLDEIESLLSGLEKDEYLPTEISLVWSDLVEILATTAESVDDVEVSLV